MSTQGGVFILPDIFPGCVCLSSFCLLCVFHMIRVTGAVRVVGNNRADDAAYDQCADPVSAVHAAVVVMMVMTWRRCRVMTLNDGAAAMDNRTAVADGAAFVRHGLCFMPRTAAMDNGTAVTDGAAFVRHRLCLGVRAAAMDNRTAVADGAAFVRHGLCFMPRTAFVQGLHSMGRRAFMNGRSCLVAGTLPLHRGFHLMAGGTFPCFRPDLPGLCRGPAAAIMMGCRCFGHAHYERSA